MTAIQLPLPLDTALLSAPVCKIKPFIRQSDWHTLRKLLMSLKVWDMLICGQWTVTRLFAHWFKIEHGREVWAVKIPPNRQIDRSSRLAGWLLRQGVEVDRARISPYLALNYCDERPRKRLWPKVRKVAA